MRCVRVRACVMIKSSHIHFDGLIAWNLMVIDFKRNRELHVARSKSIFWFLFRFYFYFFPHVSHFQVNQSVEIVRPFCPFQGKTITTNKYRIFLEMFLLAVARTVWTSMHSNLRYENSEMCVIAVLLEKFVSPVESFVSISISHSFLSISFFTFFSSLTTI